MHEKLQSVCDEIIQDEAKAKKFMELKTPEEIYAYFKEKIPNLSEDEFEDFTVTMLDDYADMQEKEPELVSDALNQVAGGVGLRKLSKQLLSGAMAVASFLPASASAEKANTANQYEGLSAYNQNYINEEYNAAKKEKGAFNKIKKWIKNHKILAAGASVVSIAAIVGTCLIVKNRYEQSKESSETKDSNKSKIKKQHKTEDSNKSEIKKPHKTEDSNKSEIKKPHKTEDSEKSEIKKPHKTEDSEKSKIKKQHKTKDSEKSKTRKPHKTDTSSTFGNTTADIKTPEPECKLEFIKKDKPVISPNSKEIVDHLIEELDSISDPIEATNLVAKRLVENLPAILLEKEYKVICNGLESLLSNYGHWDDNEQKFKLNPNLSEPEMSLAKKQFLDYFGKYNPQLDSDTETNFSDGVLDNHLISSNNTFELLCFYLDDADELRLLNYFSKKFISKNKFSIKSAFLIVWEEINDVGENLLHAPSLIRYRKILLSAWEAIIG